jgi:hypothetical protein
MRQCLLPIVASEEHLFLVSEAPLTTTVKAVADVTLTPEGPRADSRWTETQSGVPPRSLQVATTFMSRSALTGLASVLAASQVGGARAISMCVDCPKSVIAV